MGGSFVQCETSLYNGKLPVQRETSSTTANFLYNVKLLVQRGGLMGLISPGAGVISHLGDLRTYNSLVSHLQVTYKSPK